MYNTNNIIDSINSKFKFYLSKKVANYLSLQKVLLKF